LRPGFGAAENIRYLVLSKGVFAMKKRVALLVALCIWKVVAAQTPYGEMPELFRPDTLPCRLGGGGSAPAAGGRGFCGLFFLRPFAQRAALPSGLRL